MSIIIQSHNHNEAHNFVIHLFILLFIFNLLNIIFQILIADNNIIQNNKNIAIKLINKFHAGTHITNIFSNIINIIIDII